MFPYPTGLNVSASDGSQIDKDSIPCPKRQNMFQLWDLRPGYGQTEGCFSDWPWPTCW